MIDPTRAALVAAHRAAKQGGGASFLGSTFGNIGSMFGAPGPYSSPSVPTYAQPMAAQAPAAPPPAAGAPTAAPIGANYNAISALLGIPVGTAAGYTPPVYRAPPVYMSDEQRRALMPQPGATGVAPPMGGEGPADEGAPPAPSGPAPFDPNAYDYSGNLRGLSGRDIGRTAVNMGVSMLGGPLLGGANTISSLLGGPNVGSAIFGEKQPAQPLTSIAYDPKFQADARARGDIYYDPFGGYYTGDQALGIGVDREYQDWLAGEQARQTEAGSIGTDYGYVPDAAHQEIGPVDYGYVPYDPFGGYYTGDQALGIGVDREYQDWLAGEQARQTEAGSIGTDYGYVPDAAPQENGYVPDAAPAPETPEVVGGGEPYPTDQ